MAKAQAFFKFPVGHNVVVIAGRVVSDPKFHVFTSKAGKEYLDGRFALIINPFGQGAEPHYGKPNKVTIWGRTFVPCRAFGTAAEVLRDKWRVGKGDFLFVTGELANWQMRKDGGRPDNKIYLKCSYIYPILRSPYSKEMPADADEMVDPFHDFESVPFGPRDKTRPLEETTPEEKEARKSASKALRTAMAESDAVDSKRTAKRPDDLWG